MFVIGGVSIPEDSGVLDLEILIRKEYIYIDTEAVGKYTYLAILHT